MLKKTKTSKLHEPRYKAHHLWHLAMSNFYYLFPTPCATDTIILRLTPFVTDLIAPTSFQAIHARGGERRQFGVLFHALLVTELIDLELNLAAAATRCSS